MKGNTIYEEKAYNKFNQLISLKKGNQTAKYTYKPDGIRLSKDVNNNKTNFVTVDGKVFAELNGSGAVTEDYIRDMNNIIRGSKVYYLYNGHGDVTQLANFSGIVTKNYDYDSYGVDGKNNWYDNFYNNDTNPWRYCGEYFDYETKTVYLRARNYAPNTGRFNSEDPERAGLNWYTYCNGNPVNRIDPSGLDSYVIYTSQIKNEEDVNKKQAEIVKKQFEKKYGTKSYIINVDSADKFVEEWNKLPEDDYDNPIDAVEIICHGHVSKELNRSEYGIGYIFFSDYSRFYAQKNDNMKNNDRYIDNINSKSINYLYFSSCNTANPDFKKNIVDAFYDKNSNARTIAGWDGGVAFVFSSKNPFFKVNQDYPSPEENNETWRYFVTKDENGKPMRKRQGYIEKNHHYWVQTP